MTIEIVPVVYDRETKNGDFKAMIKSGKHNDTAFIINENLLHMSDWEDNTAGAGTAELRPLSWQYNQDNPKQSEQALVVGIPTGVSIASRGFKALDQFSKKVLRLSFMRIVLLLRRFPHIQRIVYSADPENRFLLGTSVFAVDEKVLQYISKSIWKLPEVVYNKDFDPGTFEDIRTKELELLVAFLSTENSNLRSELVSSKKRSSPYTSYGTSYGTSGSSSGGSGSIVDFLHKRGKVNTGASLFF